MLIWIKLWLETISDRPSAGQTCEL